MPQAPSMLLSLSSRGRAVSSLPTMEIQTATIQTLAHHTPPSMASLGGSSKSPTTPPRLRTTVADWGRLTSTETNGLPLLRRRSKRKPPWKHKQPLSASLQPVPDSLQGRPVSRSLPMQQNSPCWQPLPIRGLAVPSNYCGETPLRSTF